MRQIHCAIEHLEHGDPVKATEIGVFEDML